MTITYRVGSSALTNPAAWWTIMKSGETCVREESKGIQATTPLHLNVAVKPITYARVSF